MCIRDSPNAMAPIIPAAVIAAQYLFRPMCHPPRYERPQELSPKDGYKGVSEGTLISNRGTEFPSFLHLFDYSTIPYSNGNIFITISVISYNIF